MKVVYLANAATIHVVKRVNAVASRGCTADLITLHRPTGADPIDERVTLHLLPFRAPAGYVLNALAVRHLLRQCQPDLLHAHYASGYGTLARLAGFHPTILSVWGSDVFDFPYRARWCMRLIKSNLAFADYIDASSPMLQRHTETLVRPRHPITILPPGVDCQRFQPRDRRSGDGELVVGTVRILEEKYGVEHLVRAFAMLQRAERVRLLIVGDGPLRGRLQRLARDLGIAGSTEFVGAVPHDEVPNHMNRLAVFVALSVHDSESLGIAVLEAAASGLPVVVSDAGGLPEVVENGVTGLVVPRRDAPAAAAAIATLLANQSLRERMGNAGRKRVLEQYEWGENADRMKVLYERVIAEPGGKVRGKRTPTGAV